MRIVSVRIPEDNIMSEDKDYIVFNSDPVQKIKAVVQPVFETTQDCHAFFDPAGKFDVDGNPNTFDLKKGVRVELMACNLNIDAGYSPVRYTYITSKDERIEIIAYVDNRNLKWISGNLGVRAGLTDILG